MMVFLPLSRSEAVALRNGTSQQPGASEPDRSPRWTGYAATDALMSSHEYDAAATEDADYAALCYAGVRALTRTQDRLRLVLAAEVPDADVRVDVDLGGAADPYGEVRVHQIQWRAVTALFSDERGSAAAVAAARAALVGDTTLPDALQIPAVQALMDDHDLLWYAPAELDQLPG